MSRVGKNPIKISENVKIELLDRQSKFGGQLVKVSGPKGNLEVNLRPEVKVTQEGDTLLVEASKAFKANAYHGLYRTLINNAVVGTTEGYSKELEIVGIGYKAEVSGQILKLTIGYTHPINFPIPEGIKIEVTENVNIKVSGYDKQVVGETAAQIRKTREPEPYKGKGIKYKNELIKRKSGKAAA